MPKDYQAPAATALCNGLASVSVSLLTAGLVIPMRVGDYLWLILRGTANLHRQL